MANWLKNAALGVALAAPLAFTQPAAAQTTVDLELILLMDVSGSVSGGEFDLQRDGYVSAFQSASIQNLITNMTNGIAVTLIHWSGASAQSQVVGWTHITDATSANAFATAVSTAARASSGNTAPGSALNFATPLFSSNTFEGDRWVIDVSGDGAQNEGADTSDARDAALTAGVDAINGLPILGESGLLAFYQNNIQGGANSFTLPAASFDDFADAVQQKLTFEITGTTPNPEPEAVALFGLGLAGLVLLRRRRKA